MMQGYAIIPLTAFFLNVFLLGIFASAKKNDIIKTFMLFLVLMAIWTAGSFLMRVEFLGLTPIWYHVSLFGIWLGVLGMDLLICKFAGVRFSAAEMVMSAIVVVMLVVNAATGVFLAPPEAIPTPDGDVKFIYTMTIGTYIMYGFLALCFVFIGGHVVTCMRRRNLTSAQMNPLVAGTVILIAGNVVIMLPPFSGIPLDIVSGAVFSICVFVSLYFKHLFPLTLAFSRRTYALVTAVSLMFFFIIASPMLESWVHALPEPFTSMETTIVSFAAVLWVIAVYAVVYKISENLFLRDYNSRLGGLQGYHTDISRSLDIYQIGNLLCQQVLKNMRGIRLVRMCVVGDDGDLKIVGSSSSFEVGKTAIDHGNAFISWLSNHREPVFLDEFAHGIEYRAMWEEEKQQLSALDADCILPLVEDDELLGAAFFTFDSHDRRLSVSDVEYLVNLSMLTSSSVRNSMLYAKVAKDAQTDDLTGLLNRKYFLASVDRAYREDPDGIMSLVIVNVDDFKLYNQLYGESVGDDALRRIADVIAHSSGEDCKVARYGGKEFAILMPGKDTRTAYRLAESLHSQIYNLNKTSTPELGSLKIITTSIGICSIPFGASNVKQLLENADMAVFQVKQHGKNGIKVFSVGEVKEGRQPEAIDRQKTYSSYESTIYALAAAIDTKDRYTFTHSNRVAYYASELAKAYGLDGDTVEIIREAGLLHDVGKIGIPENILNKAGRLTAEEYEIMKRHPENAVSIIRHLPNLDYVIPAVIGHHERWDGRGYPRQLKGEEIPLSARILCVADCFDAITTKRCYQEPRPVDAALKIMEEGRGTQFDPALVDIFVAAMRSGSIQLQEGKQHSDRE